VGISADGNTAAVAGSGPFGASIFTRSNGVWSQQGPELIGGGAAGSVIFPRICGRLEATGGGVGERAVEIALRTVRHRPARRLWE